SVVRHSGVVLEGGDLDALGGEAGDRGLTAGADALDADLALDEAHLAGLGGGALGGTRGGEGRALARSLEPHGAGAVPAQGLAVDIGDRDDRVVERRLHVRDSSHHVLADLFLLLSHGSSPTPCGDSRREIARDWIS